MFNWLSNIWTRDQSRGRNLRIPSAQSVAGETVNHQTASTVSAYYAAIRNVSEDIGKIPSPIYDIDKDGNKKLARDNPAFNLLNLAPNPMMTAMTFKELLNSWAQGWGNGFAEIERDGSMRPTALWPIHPARVSPWVSEDRELYYYVYPDYDIRYGQIQRKGEPIILADWQMLHIKGPTEFGIWGKSVLECMAESLGIAIASQKYGAAFYGNGANYGGFVVHPSELSETAATRLSESIRDNSKGAGKAGGLMLLEEGMKFESTTISPKDAQALELRQFQVEEIARWFRIQPHKLQDLSKATYSNIESQNLDYVTDTLLSWSTRWEGECQNKLLDLDTVISFDFNFLLKGDRAARATYYSTLHFMGVLNVNEIRKAEGFNSIGPKGDEHYQQSAMIPLGQSTTETSASSFDAVVVNASQRIASKEARACEAESKKDRDHSEWCLNFWQDQTSFAISTFMPLISTMSQMKVLNGPSTIEAFTDSITAKYHARQLNPLTAHDIAEIFNASKR
jgi:HK97 family phage portal protein